VIEVDNKRDICNMAFPIAHNETIKPYQVREEKDIKKTIQGAYGGLKEVMVYVHVPFCQTKCQFCEVSASSLSPFSIEWNVLVEHINFYLFL